jgi:1-phosphofructokinase family hexose kinase
MITCLGLSPALDVTYGVHQTVPGSIHRPDLVLALPGGKSLNVARAVARLGGSARAIAPLGGFTGARVRAALTGSGIDVRAIDTDAETRMCVTVIDDDAVTTEFYEHAVELSETAWTAIAAEIESQIDTRPDASDAGWLALSGAVPRGAESRVAALLAAASERGIRVAVDTHGIALEAILETSAPALVKVNRHEAADLLGNGTAAELAGRLSAASGATAIVTDGAAGAHAAATAGRWHASPPEAGRYAVGSGDCFFAGLLVSLDRDPVDLPQALDRATAAATANTATPGAALFDPAEVERLRTLVRWDPDAS